MKTKKVKAVKMPKVILHEERENYLQNRNIMIEDFHSALNEVQQDKPSVGGVIGGMNYQQFSAKVVFMTILEQEEYIAYSIEHNPPYVDVKEEKTLLKTMVKEAKKVFGSTYDAWYQDAKKDK